MSTEINPLMVNLEAQLSRRHQGTLGWAKVSFPPAWEVAKESHWWQLGCYCSVCSRYSEKLNK